MGTRLIIACIVVFMMLFGRVICGDITYVRAPVTSLANHQENKSWMLESLALISISLEVG